MAKPKPGQHVRKDKIADYELSKFQDELREALEAVDELQLVIADLGRRAEVIKRAMNLPAASFSLRDESEFYE